VPESETTKVPQASNEAVLYSNVRLQSHRRENFVLPVAMRKDTGANRMDLLKTQEPSTTDDEFQNDMDDERDDEDEDFYEKTLKKNYAKSNSNNNVDLNNTRSSTLTSSSSCSSAFSSMSNLNSNHHETAVSKRDAAQKAEFSSENKNNNYNQVTVDLSKYLNNDDDDDDDDNDDEDQASYGDAEDESFDEYLNASPAKTSSNSKMSKNLKPNEYFTS